MIYNNNVLVFLSAFCRFVYKTTKRKNLLVLTYTYLQFILKRLGHVLQNKLLPKPSKLRTK